MRNIQKQSTVPYGWLIATLAVLFFGLVGFASSEVSADSSRPASGKRLITIHDNGQDKAILTDAPTLRQAFKEEQVRVDASDMVEPGLDEALVASNYEVNVYRARPVTIVDGAVRQRVMSPYRTAKQIVAHAGMTLHDEDVTDMAVTADMVSDGAGVQLTINRATPLTLVLYGKKTQAYTQAKTVKALLDEKNITLRKGDSLSVAQDAAISKGMKIELWRNGKQTVTEEQSVAYDVQQIQDADREVGYKRVKTPGVQGKKTVTYEITMKNGREVSRKQIQSVVTKEPKAQIEVVGTKMTNSFSGDFAAALARLRSCEGSYTSNTGNGYYGAYQYDIGTWGGYKGYANASLAPPPIQDEKAWLTYQARGWSPWPSCSISQGLQDIYR